MSQEIELYNRIQNPIEAIDRMGEFFAKSQMFGCENEAQGKVLAATCLTERMSPVAIKRKFHLFQGELSMRADAMLADLRTKLGGKHKVIERSEKRAAVELTVEGQTLAFDFTFEDAKKEPFVYARDGRSFKKNWATPRARMQMLWARVVSDAVRTMAPEIVAGSYTPEEIEDFTPENSRELLPPKPAKEVKQARVESVRTVAPAPEAADPAPAAAPQTPAEPAPAEKPVVDNWANPKDPSKLSAEAAGALMQIIPTELHNKAQKWLEEKGWIPPMGSLADLSPARAQKIYARSGKFISELKA